MSDDLPASGEPGLAPPTPGSLPRPAMWPAGAQGTPFDGAAEDTATPPSAGRRRVAFLAVAVMIVGVVLVGLSAVQTSWTLLVVGLVVGALGGGMGLRVRIMEDVSVSGSPHGPG